ncbi:G-protein alpha subunit-domain-containing protein [Rhypophila decipiens]|uniref:G-protein alpha subunit-domain-containing protein n=1 Tax=Rhypophila decipiens TaxID=261697 RepID=A0AAN6XUJ1_9PEZI|nr:G-protein alpha subunit-domain-containing protein [Rhypophila decipiens]
MFTKMGVHEKDNDFETDRSTKEETDSTASLLIHHDNDFQPACPITSLPIYARTDASFRSRVPSLRWLEHILPTRHEIEAKKRSRAIDRSIMEDEERRRREHKIIVLGSRSGDDIIKTMRKEQARRTVDTHIDPEVHDSIVDVRVPVSENFTAHLFNLPRRMNSRERKNWIHFFQDGLKAVFFVVDLDIYNKTLFEAPEENQMQESIMLFESIANSTFFEQATPVLIFNRVEVLKEKLARYSFKKDFPDYAGDENDIEAMVEYLVGQFNQGVKDLLRGRIPGYALPAEEHVMFEQVVRATEENVLPFSEDGRVL